MSVTTAEVQANLADPVLSAALAAGDDTAAAVRLSELLTENVMIPIGRVAAWGARVGLRAKIQDYSTTSSHPLRSVSLTALDMLVRGSDFDMVEDGPMLQSFLDAGDITQAQYDELSALSVAPRQVSAQDVAQATRNEDGSSKL